METFRITYCDIDPECIRSTVLRLSKQEIPYIPEAAVGIYLPHGGTNYASFKVLRYATNLPHIYRLRGKWYAERDGIFYKFNDFLVMEALRD